MASVGGTTRWNSTHNSSGAGPLNQIGHARFNERSSQKKRRLRNRTPAVSNALARLLEIVPAPSRSRDKDWGGVERALSVELPDDYKEFIDVYGGSNWDDYLYVLEPDCPNKHYDLLIWAKYQFEDLQDLWTVEKKPTELETEGSVLIAWATTDNGECLYWLVLPGVEPNGWTVMANEVSDRWEHYPVSCTDSSRPSLPESCSRTSSPPCSPWPRMNSAASVRCDDAALCRHTGTRGLAGCWAEQPPIRLTARRPGRGRACFAPPCCTGWGGNSNGLLISAAFTVIVLPSPAVIELASAKRAVAPAHRERAYVDGRGTALFRAGRSSSSWRRARTGRDAREPQQSRCCEARRHRSCAARCTDRAWE
ncbi:SMI1/KNR4 family protein [Nocardia sp. NPDC058666]